MKIWQAIVLGITQGLTEFLPVSSSGHLLLLQRFFGIDSGYSLFFTVMLHIGTLIPVFVVFFKQILGIFSDFKKILHLIIATVPAVIVGLTLGDVLEEVFYDGKFLPICFMFTAVVLLVADLYPKKRQLAVNCKNSLGIGLAQAIAVVPGVSRSGLTTSCGTLLGVSGEENANFSFLLSIPIILGSALMESIDVVKTGIDIDFWPLIIGVLFAMVSGFFAVKIMLKVIKKAKYRWFSLYLALLSVVLLILNFV